MLHNLARNANSFRNRLATETHTIPLRLSHFRLVFFFSLSFFRCLELNTTHIKIESKMFTTGLRFEKVVFFVSSSIEIQFRVLFYVLANDTNSIDHRVSAINLDIFFIAQCPHEAHFNETELD